SRGLGDVYKRQGYRSELPEERAMPLVVLVNGGSASASEIIAGAVQDRHCGLLVGEKTFGKGSVQSLFVLAGKAAVKLTVARYYTPSGRCIDGVGIVPDVEVAGQATDGGDVVNDRQLSVAIERVSAF
ncbi:MAG: S41 family peptidase, partial [Negativicutes bacterium]|nr:S41 family peptidase [Negativicutes bacterium]